MRQEDSWWQCECGARVRLSAGRTQLYEAFCPECGAKVDSTKPPFEVSAADTQMVNIAEMARMAQEGLDIEASGEWETQPEKHPESQKDPKDER